MLKLASLQHEYSLVFSEDPALDLPEIPNLAEDAPAEDVKRRATLALEREHKLKVARETGRWSEIVRAGTEPTIFSVAPITGSALTWLQGESRRRKLGNEEGTELAVRLALRKVVNLGALEVQHDFENGHRLVTRATMDALYAIGHDAGDPTLGRRLVLELGSLVLVRAMAGISPP